MSRHMIQAAAVDAHATGPDSLGADSALHPADLGATAGAPAAPTRFDGVICFGDSDWWYHNRGHYDMQMMREFSARVPVLYVNSLGVRTPKLGEGRMFFRRVTRKLKSLARGLTHVRPNFSVFSPIAAPGRIGRAVTKRTLAPQVRLAARRCGIRRPLVWVACPPGADMVDRLRPEAVVYQRTDSYENLPGVDRAQVLAWDRFLKQRADLTLYCSSWLMQREAPACRRALFVDHGVDYDRFAAAGAREGGAPDDLAAVPRPRAGFIGGIDAHTFDAPLFVDAAGRLPDVQFVLVGGCSLPQGWCPHGNVHLLGQRPYEQVADYMAACDVLIMPWNQNDWIKACNPVKLKEYLAVGRPVVSTPFEELHRYEGLVSVAVGGAAFAEAIRAALDSGPAEAGRERVARETWTAKAGLVAEALQST